MTVLDRLAFAFGCAAALLACGASPSSTATAPPDAGPEAGVSPPTFWTGRPPVTSLGLNAVWGSGGDLYAVGQGGVIVHGGETWGVSVPGDSKAWASDDELSQSTAVKRMISDWRVFNPMMLPRRRGARGADDLPLRCMAAQQYLRSGRLDEGIHQIRELMKPAGLRWPRTRAEAVVMVLWNKALVTRRGYERARVEESLVSPARLRRLDLLGAVFRELGALDVLRGVALQTQFLREALEAGEPRRLLLALAWEAFNTALMAGAKRARDTEQLLDAVAALARDLGTPYALAMAQMSRAGCLYFLARFEEGLVLARSAEMSFRAHCPGTGWEQQLLTCFRLGCLEWTGSLAEIAQEAPAIEREARDRDDKYAQGCMALSLPAAHLMADDPKAALEVLRAHRPPVPGSITTPDIWVVNRTVDSLNYAGRGREALEYYAAMWPHLTASPHYRAVPFRVLAHWFRIKSAIGAFVECGARGALALARRSARALQRTDSTDAWCLAALAHASLAHLRGDAPAARRHLVRAIHECDAYQTRLLAVYARLNLGLALGGSEGRTLTDGAVAALRQQAVKDPLRWVATYAPGFVGRR